MQNRNFSPTSCPTTVTATCLLLIFLTSFSSCKYVSKQSQDFPSKFQEKNSVSKVDLINTDSGNCGGVIKLTGSRRINYKPFEEILPNERCVWILTFSNEVNVSFSYEITANILGFPASDRFLTYTSLRKGLETTEQSYPSAQGSTVELVGNVLLVTFHTKQNTSGQNGFIITVSPTKLVPGVNVSSRYEILNPEEFYHKHPKTNEDYLINELTALVLPPLSPYHGSFRKRIVLCKELGLTGWILDYIGIHLFDANSSSYKFKGSLGGGFNRERISHDDIILIVFDSYHIWGSQGFELFSLAH